MKKMQKIYEIRNGVLYVDGKPRSQYSADLHALRQLMRKHVNSTLGSLRRWGSKPVLEVVEPDRIVVSWDGEPRTSFRIELPQWEFDRLVALADELNIRSTSGPRRGEPSPFALVRAIARGEYCLVKCKDKAE